MNTDTQHPNTLCIITDQQRYDRLSCNGTIIIQELMTTGCRKHMVGEIHLHNIIDKEGVPSKQHEPSKDTGNRNIW